MMLVRTCSGAMLIALLAVSSSRAYGWTGDAYTTYDYLVAGPTGSTLCGSAGDANGVWRDYTEAWANALTGSSGYNYVYRFYNRMEDKWFVDPSKQSWGNDNGYLDYSRAVLIASHGSSSVGSVEFHLLQHHEWPSQPDGCYSHYENWELGNKTTSGGGSNNTTLDFIHMFACYSSNVGPQLTTAAGWLDKASGVHVGGGFHAESRVLSMFTTRTTDFVNQGMSESIVRGWRDHLTAFNVYYDYDQCAIPWVIGNGSSDAWNRWNEQYDETRSDPVPATYLGYWYICDCCAKTWNNAYACTPSC